MDFKTTDLYDSTEDYEHLAQIHSARPRFKNPTRVENAHRHKQVSEIERFRKLQMGEGCQFDVDDFVVDDEFDNEEEVFDEDTMSMFCFGDPSIQDKQTEVNHFDVERFGHTDFMETEKLMSPLNPEKTVMKMGSDQKVPERSKLYVHYTAISEGSFEVFDTTMTRKYPYVVDLRQESLLPGLDLAMKSMSFREVARFIIYPEMAYGVLGCPPRIPANAKIMYVIEILQYIDEAKLNTPAYMTSDERSRLPFETIVEEVKRLRGDGNGYYEDKNYPFAIKKWRKAVIMIEEYLVGNEEDDKVRRELVWMLYANLAQGYLRLERPAQACSACKLGLKSAEEHGSSSVKLFFRFAKAKLMLKDHSAALGLINDALIIEPSNKDCLQLKREILEDQGKTDDVFKNMCRKMFSDNRRSPKKCDKGGFMKGKGFTDLMNQVQESSEKVKKLTLEKPTDRIDWDSELNVPDGAYCSEEQLKKLNSELLKASKTKSKQYNMLNVEPGLVRNFIAPESKADAAASSLAEDSKESSCDDE